MNWNPGWGPPPSYGGERIVYVPISTGQHGEGVHVDPIAAIARSRDDLDRLEKMFKKGDEKKDSDKKKHWLGLSEGDIRWILILTAPFTGYIMCSIYINLFTHWPTLVPK